MCPPALKHNGRACGCTTAGVHAPLAVARLIIKQSRATETVITKQIMLNFK